ncbi:hypothetical protein PVK06_040171 [Gossypium arboreum]|uniref:Uncharacterized protein n=1 Tax=Gossypium arboreum TaxID=29729 RepID=A0ABR0N5C6_GOSAR|nr:hypothetical protein PVK06_040171 [Gossypium arboreum]
MLKRVGGMVNEICIFEGDFNTIANNAKKEGGRRKSKALMDDFCNVIEELSLVDIKTVRGWYTWVNNREGSAMVKELLNRFMISANDVANFPYIETKVVRQSTLDHDAITLDTMGGKSREGGRYQGFNCKYEAYWANDRKAKEVIQHAWKNSNIDVVMKMEKVGQDLCHWQVWVVWVFGTCTCSTLLSLAGKCGILSSTWTPFAVGFLVPSIFLMEISSVQKGLTNPPSHDLALPKPQKLWKMVLFGLFVMGKRLMYGMIGGVSRDATNFLTLLWICGNSRNNRIFMDKKDNAREVWERAMTFSEDFRMHNLVNSAIIPVTTPCKTWTKPPTGVIKINFDATVSNGRMGYSVFARDGDGFVVGGSGGTKDCSMSSKWVKM